VNLLPDVVFVGELFATEAKMAKIRMPVIAIFAAMSLCSGAQSAPDLEGAYRGMFVCEQVPGSVDILHVPLDVAVRGDNIQFARPLFNLQGTRVLGSELGSGTIESDGKMHLTSEWTYRGIAVSGDYSGVLTPTGGTLTGTQTWRGQGKVQGSRTCTAALVPAPKPERASSQQ
jgi:hypothetical protein